MSVRMTIVEDKPLHEDVALTDLLGNTLDDLLGSIDEVLVALIDGERTLTEQTVDARRIWQTLTLCQEQFNHLQHRCCDLISYERIVALKQLGRRGGEWRLWATTAIDALTGVQQVVYEVGRRLVRCWQEAAEWSGRGTVSIQTTNVGQQIVVPAERRLGAERGEPDS